MAADGDARLRATAPVSPGGTDISGAVITRYRDAYRVARAMIFIGSATKLFGIILLIGLPVGSLALADSSDLAVPLLGAGVIVGIGLGAIIYLLGVLVAAQGQFLIASLDGAVHSSPFLTDSQRIRAMQLSTRSSP